MPFASLLNIEKNQYQEQLKDKEGGGKGKSGGQACFREWQL